MLNNKINKKKIVGVCERSLGLFRTKVFKEQTSKAWGDGIEFNLQPHVKEPDVVG